MKVNLMNYKPTRIGLLNFWLYDDEEFDFADGKLLLRGENGSGKSVTMQSFIPLILDGNKSPKRLDPFGSTDKHIEAYLLGGYDTEQKNEATGYLFMEFYEESSLKYITIGMGLHARKGRPVDFWGFAITDGKRINRDFFLYKNHVQKVPLSKNELRTALGPMNTLVDTTKEYKKMVNNILFGFQNLEDYDEFINVLIQLRSPKLSKDYKPTVLMDILSKVLQPLTEDDLRPLSEAVEEMDNTKEKIEQLKKHLKQLSYLMQSYRNYNESILYKKASNFKESRVAEEKAKAELAEIENKIVNAEKKIVELDQSLTELEIELEAAKKSRSEIDSKDLESNIQKVKELEEAITKLNAELSGYSERQEALENKRLDTEKKKKHCEDELTSLERRIARTINSIDGLCSEVMFNDPVLLLKDYQKDNKNIIDFDSILQRTNGHNQKLYEVLSKLKEKTIKEKHFGEIESEMNILNKEQSDLIHKLEIGQSSLEEMLATMRDEILFIEKTNQFVKFDADDKNRLLKPTYNFSKSNYDEAKTFYQNLADSYYKEANKAFYFIENKLKATKENLSTLHCQLEELKNQKEEEIPLDIEEESTFAFLKSQNVPFIPFYKAVDFIENLSAKTKNHIEATMLKAGLLNALLIDTKDLEKVVNHKGVFLTPGPKKRNNLTKYFSCAKNIDFDSKIVINVLESLSIDSNELISFSENSFKIETIHGYGAQNENQKYIGILARIEAHQKTIDAKMSAIKEVEETKAQLEKALEEKGLEVQTIEHEKTLYPNDTKVEEIIIGINELELRLDIKKKEILQTEEKATSLKDSLNILYKEINEHKDTIALPLTEESISDALSSLTTLINEINDLKSDYQQLIQNRENLSLIGERIEEITASLGEIYLKIEENKKTAQKYMSTKNNIEEILNSEETKKLSELLRTLDEKIDSIPKKQGNLREEKGTLVADLTNYKTALENNRISYNTKKEMTEIYRNIFVNEYNLNYVMKCEGNDTELANRVFDQLSAKKNADEKTLFENFVDNYNKYKNELAEYKLSYKTLFETVEEGEFKAVYETATRRDYTVIYQGRTMNLFALENELNASIIENEQIISDQDRNLFEEILLKTVGNKIREHIDDAKKWIKTINQIMRNMQTSSALSFQLEWHPKDKDSIDEIDTRELISLFNINPDMIKPSDSDKLIKHFRSKLKSRIEEETHESYADIIFDILDYRNWFQFKMYYTRAGENRHELTDKVFSVFSGGEKAKTMYLPLFTAVCAKLQSARKNAPHIVALDEAFAGVDDANIREMFGIMGSLNLDYILTSQALWGDFDTIKELGISELLRPNNSSVVGIRRYHWNGFVKEVVQKRKVEDEPMDIF